MSALTLLVLLFGLLLPVLSAAPPTPPPCEFTQEEGKVLAAIRTCEGDLEDFPMCLAKCVLEKMGWANETGYPDPWKAQAEMEQLPEGQYKEAALRLVSCIKTRARLAQPDEENCKTYKTMGICMKRVIQVYCGSEFIPSPPVK